MHVVSAGLTHDQYMRFRAAIKQENVTCAAFVRILITTGLDAAQEVVKKGKVQAQVQAKIAALKKQIASLEAINIAPVNPVAPVNPAKDNTSKCSHKNIEGYLLSLLSKEKMHRSDIVFTARNAIKCSKTGVYSALKKMCKNGNIVVEDNGMMCLWMR